VLPDGKTVREHAREATPKALEFLLQTLNDPKASLQMRISAALGIIRCGHADAPRGPEGFPEGGLTVLVEQLVSVPPSDGYAGVLRSPITGDIDRHPQRRLFTQVETIEAESEVPQ